MHIDHAYLTQYDALTQAAGFAPLPARTILALTGNDRITFLHAFCTNNIKALTPGRGCEAFITSPQGKTLGHTFVFCEADQLLLDTSPGQAADLIAHFNKYIISEDVNFIDRSAELSDFLVAGPSAHALLAQLVGVKPPEKLLDHAPAMLANYPVSIRRVEYAASASFFVQVPSAALRNVEQALNASGAVRCDLAAVESARLEAGIPLFGLDIMPDNLPQEVGRDAQAISFTKGCYLGQETVARVDALGHVNRQLVGVKLVGDSIPRAGAMLLSNDKEVGHVTSVAWSPTLQAPFAFAFVRRPYAKPGTQLSTDIGSAEVVALPIAGR
jgi:folate-binding protein YgfZ